MRALALFDGLFLLFSLLTLGFPKLAEMVSREIGLERIIIYGYDIISVVGGVL